MVAFAAVALAFVIGPHRLGDYMTETDFYGAYAKGAQLVQSGILDPSRYGVIGPGYEVALALFGFVIPDLFVAAEILSLVSSLAVLLLWFALVRRRVNGMAACFTVLFIATNAHFLRHAYSALTDAFAIALQSAALFLLLGRPVHRPAPAAGADAGSSSMRAAWFGPGDSRMLAAGVFAGLAFLTRYNSIAILIAGAVAIALGATGATHRLRGVAAFVVGFALPVAPWVLYSLARGQHFTFQLHHNIAYEVFARARGIAWDDYQKKMQP